MIEGFSTVSSHKPYSDNAPFDGEYKSIKEPSNFHLGIIIPLKAKATSRDWRVTCERLHATLKSLIGQNSRAFSVAIAGHDIPRCVERLRNEDWLSIAQVAHAIPNLELPTELERQQEITRDKNEKIVQGIRRLSSANPTHWFALDADDFVDRDFVETVSRLPPDYGAILSAGFQIHVPTNRFRIRRNLPRLCGSTSILPAACVVLEEHAREFDQLSETPYGKIPWCRFSHHNMERYFQDEYRGRYVRVGKPLIAYLVGHGDNASDGYHRWRRGYYISELFKSLLLGKDATSLALDRFSQ